MVCENIVCSLDHTKHVDDWVSSTNTHQYAYQFSKETTMNIPIIPEEACTAAGDHYLCYRVRCNLDKKCYVKEQEKNKKEEDKPKES